MMKRYWLGVPVMAVILVALYVYFFPISQTVQVQKSTSATTTKVAMFANGCFWCVEADFEKVPGVISAVSGYADGEGVNPTYEDYGARGFREVVEVTYDPSVVSYEQLVEHTLKHGDPTDGGGSFYDRGFEYSPAIYFENDNELADAKKVLTSVEAKGIFDKPLAIALVQRSVFFSAEEYHQDYYLKNPVRYAYYRKGSGRDAFIEKHWGADTKPTPLVSVQATTSWRNFVKPSIEVLKTKLTPLQFEVTQEDGTESPFANEYDKNTAEGIYVDIVSGEPLYSSKDKFDSGTGWPSFVKPLVAENIVIHEDRSLFFLRSEVRSKRGDSHLGHVFDDGPKDRGGLRYCMNSASLRFIPKDKLAEMGYAEFEAEFK